MKYACSKIRSPTVNLVIMKKMASNPARPIGYTPWNFSVNVIKKKSKFFAKHFGCVLCPIRPKCNVYFRYSYV